MAKAKGAAGAPADNVVQMGSTCAFEKCGKKAERMGFCSEHYAWFKEGLINKKGQKPSDFDKKYQSYLMRQKAA